MKESVALVRKKELPENNINNTGLVVTAPIKVSSNRHLLGEVQEYRAKHTADSIMTLVLFSEI